MIHIRTGDDQVIAGLPDNSCDIEITFRDLFDIWNFHSGASVIHAEQL
jgi:hypothetical protein